MNYDIKAGCSRVNITPPLGIDMWGYFIERKATGILDELEINTVVIEKNGKRVFLLSVDTCGLYKEFINKAKDLINKELDIDKDSLFIHSTHTHTGGSIGMPVTCPIVSEFNNVVIHKIKDSIVMAIDDLKPSKMGWALSEAKNVAFNRRYLMKDGSYKTNPGVNNPDIVKSAGAIDERVNVIRIKRECGDNLVLINFGNHPDTVGGTKISADWPGFTRRIFEKAIDDTKCIVFNGAQGDINHVNVWPKGGDFNDMFNDFDDVSRGYGHARHIGNVMAASAMQVYDKVEYVEVDNINFIQRYIDIPLNKANPNELEDAYALVKLYNDGKFDEIPYKGMMLTTVLASANRKIRLKDQPDNLKILLSGIRIGKFGFIGIPGEPFCGIGIALKKAPDYDMILPCCNTNSKEGYFPMKDSYEEGGYEAEHSNFKSGVAEIIIEEGLKLLDDLKN